MSSTPAVRAAEKAGLKSEDIALFVPHQANARIIESAAKRLGVGMDRVFVNVDRYGNTSCGSIPIALIGFFGKDFIRDRRLRRRIGLGITGRPLGRVAPYAWLR